MCSVSLIPLCKFFFKKKQTNYKSQADLPPDAKAIGKDRGGKGGNIVGFLRG